MSAAPGVIAGDRAVGPDGLVALDLPCGICGYSVRGLRRDAVCPECATPVERSLRRGLLRHASPAYLAMLHRGAFLLLVGAVGVLAIPILLLLLDVLFPGIFGAGVTLSFAATIVVSLMGWWLISAPDPGLRPEEPAERSRRLLRSAIGAHVLAAAVIGIVIIVERFVAFPPAVLSLWGTVMSVGITLLLLGGAAAGLLHIRRTAARIPEPWLERRARVLLWLSGVIVVCYINLYIANHVFGIGRAVPPMPGGGGAPAPTPPTPPAPPGPPGPVARGVGGRLVQVVSLAQSIAFLAWFVMFVGLFDRFRLALKGQRALAAQFAAEGAVPEPEPPIASS